MNYPTPADLLVEALRLPPLSTPPEKIPGGGWCAITGQPITCGYRVSDVTTDATSEFLDTFHGDVHGWVSESAARCYKNADPREGNPTARSFFIIPGLVTEQPLLDRNAEQHAFEALEARCIGNRDEIIRLLAQLDFVGKRRAIGFGEVAEIRVETGEFSLIENDELTRPIPALSVHLLGNKMPTGEPCPVGWTPPQWMPSLFAPGWWSGTRVVRISIDNR